MTHQNNTHGAGENAPELFEVDRVLDALGRGELTAQKADDPIIALLSAARAEADRDIPAPPNVAEIHSGECEATPEFTAELTPIGQPKRAFRRGLSALAAGGASATAMIIAGGVAAAIAVGGLGYAAYSNSQIRTAQENQDVRAEGTEEDITVGTNGSTAPAAPKRDTTDTTKDGGEDVSGAVNSGGRDNQPTPAEPADKPAEPTEAVPGPQAGLETLAESLGAGVAEENGVTEGDAAQPAATVQDAEIASAPLPAAPPATVKPTATTTSPTETTTTKKPTTAKPKNTLSGTAPQAGADKPAGS